MLRYGTKEWEKKESLAVKATNLKQRLFQML